MPASSTNPIGKGTVNVSVNLQQELSTFLGRLAHHEDLSKGKLIQELVHDGLKLRDPQLAAKWDNIKSTRYAQAVALCVIGSVVVWQSIFSTLDIRRTSSRIRMQRREQVA